MSPLISIIIPTFNRAHLIKNTLNSILQQSYENWECLIVDDGSSDNTEAVVSSYIKSNPRFKYFTRPDEKLKGANSCRNYGLDKSMGDYIIWFDSDDFMDPDCLYLHLKAIFQKPFNYSVSKFDNVVDGVRQEETLFLNNIGKDINGIMFLKQEIFFGTINVLFKKEFIGKTRWNESLKSGQEYNFFCRLLIRKNEIGIYLDQVLTFRVVHSDSIQFIQNRDDSIYLENKLNCYYQTLIDSYQYLKQDEIHYLINHCLSFYFRLMKFKTYSYNLEILNFITSHLSFYKRTLFKFSLILNSKFNKGYTLYKNSTFML